MLARAHGGEASACMAAILDGKEVSQREVTPKETSAVDLKT